MRGGVYNKALSLFLLPRGEEMKKKYFYDGSVMEFDICIANHWKASTYAVSEQKARGNLTHQFKTKHNRIPSSKITLPGKLVLAQ